MMYLGPQDDLSNALYFRTITTDPARQKETLTLVWGRNDNP